MRTNLIIAGGLAALVISAWQPPASAQTRTYYPWCAEEPDESGGALSCGFVSYAQCMATASGLGGHCIRNPYETPPTSEGSRRRRRG
jgi:hypothetical protein